MGELPPAPRRPAEEASVVAAVRDNTLVVLDDFDAAATAGAVAALVADGRRVVVTAATPAELAAVHAVLPAGAAERTLTTLPPLPPADLRELRRLLATSTPQRRARVGQALPPGSALPPAGEVAHLCALAAQQPTASEGAWMIPALLAELDPKPLAAVTAVAHDVDRALAALQPRGRQEWAWRLLSELIYSRQRAAFDTMIDDTALAVAAVERAHLGPPVDLVDAPPPGAVEALQRYRDFLASGGRSRSMFRSAAQRDVQPVLDRARVAGRVPESEQDVQLVIEYMELVERRDRIEAGCLELGLPAPRDERELAQLADLLGRVAAAAGAVSTLRHDVLFLSAESPLAVPDVETAAEIATAILDYADHGSAPRPAAGSTGSPTGWPAAAPPHPSWTRPSARCAPATRAATPSPSTRSAPPAATRTTRPGGSRCSRGWPPTRRSWPPRGRRSPTPTRPRSVWRRSCPPGRCCPRSRRPTPPTSCWCSGRPRWASSGCCSRPSPRVSSPWSRPARRPSRPRW
ncbi:hypothetical protein BJF78_12545 [Pseudonocardia sp. CNS-139]|nr:hypothetical protein BJF78_12545 [Pseudonocardia sp. CNS-139]